MGNDKTNGIAGPSEPATGVRPIEDVPPAPRSSKASIEPTETPRWEVTVERQLLIYAPDAATAELKALEFMGFRKGVARGGVEPPAIPCKVVEVRQLQQPIDEPRTPVIEGPSGRPSGKP